MLRLRIALTLLLAAAACGGDSTTPTDSGVTDTGAGDSMIVTDATADATTDGGVDPRIAQIAADWTSKNELSMDPMLPAMLGNLVPPAGSPVSTLPRMTHPAGNSALVTADYIGAFEPGAANWMAGWTTLEAPESGMPITDPRPGRTTVMVTSNITADTTWTADNIYVLAQQTFVMGATLTIQPGTEIRGEAANVALVVTTSGRIMAEGTAESPIVFTSNLASGSRAPSDWGGVVLLGSAPINVPGGTDTVEGLPPDTALGAFGGTDAAHNCGTMRYVRIEWAGYEFAMDKEFNGLTIAGCGSQTNISYVQVHGSSDGVEFFGGNANLNHIVVTYAQDDSIDTDAGYQGTIQFLAVIQDAGGDEGWEADNLESDNEAMPRSNPIVFNATMIGGGGSGQRGVYWRRGTAGTFANSILQGFGDDCIGVKGDVSIGLAASGLLHAEGNIIRECNGGMAPFVIEN